MLVELLWKSWPVIALPKVNVRDFFQGVRGRHYLVVPGKRRSKHHSSAAPRTSSGDACTSSSDACTSRGDACTSNGDACTSRGDALPVVMHAPTEPQAGVGLASDQVALMSASSLSSSDFGFRQCRWRTYSTKTPVRTQPKTILRERSGVDACGKGDELPEYTPPVQHTLAAAARSFGSIEGGSM